MSMTDDLPPSSATANPARDGLCEHVRGLSPAEATKPERDPQAPAAGLQPWTAHA